MTLNILLHIALFILYIWTLTKLLGLQIRFASRFIASVAPKNAFAQFFLRIMNVFVLVFGSLTLFAIITGVFARIAMIGIQ